MALRETLTAELVKSMKAGTSARTATLRMVSAKLKDADIAARPGPPLDDDAAIGTLRGMIKSRRESVLLYIQGNRPELAAKEEAEIVMIEFFLPQAMDDAALATAVDAAVTETGASAMKDMGKVMAALKTTHGAALDMARANPLVRARLI